MPRPELAFCVDLGAKQHDEKRKIEPEQEHDHRSERAISRVITAEVRDVERKGGRGEQPNQGGEYRARADPLPLRGRATWAVAVEQREKTEYQEREQRPARHPDDEFKLLRVSRIVKQDRHIDDGEQYDDAANYPQQCEYESAQIVVQQAVALGFVIGNVKSRKHCLGQRHHAPNRKSETDDKAPAEQLAGGFGKPVDLADDEIIGLGR